MKPDESNNVSQTTSVDEESFKLELSDDPDTYLKKVHAGIAQERSRTENAIAKILIWALVLSLPAYFLSATFIEAEIMSKLDSVFDKWLTVIGALGGAAVGVGAHSRKKIPPD